MPEKAANSSVSTFSWILRWNPMIHWWFKVLTLSFFVGLLIVWGIDGWSFRSSQKDFVMLKLNNALNQTINREDLRPYIASVHPNFDVHEKSHDNLTHTHQNLTHTQKNLTSFIATITANLTQNQLKFTNFNSKSPNFTNFSSQNQPIFTDSSSHDSVNLTLSPAPILLNWISAELEPNYTSNLLSRWRDPGGEPCKDSKTVEISVPRLDGHDPIELPTGHIHEFVFQALDESGKHHCSGGDYFEIDLSGERWKSRPPVKDLGNGTYSFSIQVHPDFTGDYNLTIILLFRHFEGLRFSPQRFVYDRELRKFSIKFHKSSAHLPELKTCEKSDFGIDVWSGRWTRHAENKSCTIDNEGRYRCLKPDFPCQSPWCDGSLGVIESNGWTYSAHCSFRLFSSQAAWDCLRGRWVFFWGDSNHCDTIRNILYFVLDVQDITVVPRRFDMNITNPRDSSQVVRITSIFNGNHNETGNYEGLSSLHDDEYRELLRGYFSGKSVPDTVIMNSGLHDGVFWKSIRRFSEGADRAAAFWAEVMGSVRQRGVVPPEVIYRSTVATGGYARGLVFNPYKMEAFNGVLLEKLRQYGVVKWVVDHFDMTYPWHYDNRCNDGVHYGRAPANARWRDGQIGHQYFVDLMLGHVLLNALCRR